MVVTIGSLIGAAAPARADAGAIGVGVALALPAAGASLRVPLGERFGAALVAGAGGVQGQLNYDGRVRHGSYGFVGLGRDGAVTLARGGYGYEWRVSAVSLHAEVGLNVPLSSDDDIGLALVGYFYPFALGLHYRFGGGAPGSPAFAPASVSGPSPACAAARNAETALACPSNPS